MLRCFIGVLLSHSSISSGARPINAPVAGDSPPPAAVEQMDVRAYFRERIP